MISYREKQLLAVMKYLQDESTAISHLMRDALNGEFHAEHTSESRLSRVGSYEELVGLAEQAGYDTFVRADDILTPEEIKDLESRKHEIEKQFKDLTKLRDADYAFLFSAVALQVVRQVILKYDLDDHNLPASETDKDYAEKYNDPNALTGEAAKRFYAPYPQIVGTKTVPYDIVKGTAFFGGSDKPTELGLSGSNHRFRSVGHDPVLGMILGTANILTNTATFYVKPEMLRQANKTAVSNYLMANFHVRYQNMETYSDPYIASYASFVKMFERVLDRLKTDPKSFIAAFVKEVDHIESDKRSVAGIPIPFITQVLGSEKAQSLAKQGFDWDHLTHNLKVFGEQAGLAVLINFMVSLLHRVYLMWDKVKAAPSISEAVKDILSGPESEFDEIRTRKIVMYSNLIASSVNLAVCLGGGAVGMMTGQAELSKEFFSHLDLGGCAVTIVELFKDTKYILKVKDDFIKSTINEDFQKKMSVLDS